MLGAKKKEKQEEKAERPSFMLKKEKVVMADAHCHLDLIQDPELVGRAIHHGVTTIITNGVDIRTSEAALSISDGARIFPAIGIDPQNALLISDERLDAEIGAIVTLAKANARKIVSIGEIGLDYSITSEPEMIEKQKVVFIRMLQIAMGLNMPVSIHARGAIQDVLEILESKRIKKAHLHFFEGSVEMAIDAAAKGYMISIPPLDSPRRRQIIKGVPIENLLVESDSPVVGKSPADVEIPLRMIAEVRGLSFEKAAEAVTANTRRFFAIDRSGNFMRA